MITVSISINGQVIFCRSAVNQGEASPHEGLNGVHCYKVDDGTMIKHRRSDGAVPLAIKLLKTIHEPHSDPGE